MFRPDIILSGWLYSKHQLCNETPHPLFVLIESVLSNILPSTMSPHPLYVLIQESVLSHILPPTMSPHPLFVLIQESVLSHILPTMSPHPLYVLIQESILSHILPKTMSPHPLFVLVRESILATILSAKASMFALKLSDVWAKICSKHILRLMSRTDSISFWYSSSENGNENWHHWWCSVWMTLGALICKICVCLRFSCLHLATLYWIMTMTCTANCFHQG